MKLFRYTDFRSTRGVEVILESFTVTKETPEGYWLDTGFSLYTESKKWVSKTAKKRFAYPTIEEAAFSFKKRKERQIVIYKSRLRNAEAALNAPLPTT